MMIHFIICQLKQFFCDKKEGGRPHMPLTPYATCLNSLKDVLSYDYYM